MIMDNTIQKFIISAGDGEEICVTLRALSQLEDAGYVDKVTQIATEKADWELMKAMVGQI